MVPVWVRSSIPTSLLSYDDLRVVQRAFSVTSGKCRRSFCTTYFYNALSPSCCVPRNSRYVSFEKDDDNSSVGRASSRIFIILYPRIIDSSYQLLSSIGFYVTIVHQRFTVKHESGSMPRKKVTYSISSWREEAHDASIGR